MPIFLGNNYAPPGVYTRTNYDAPTPVSFDSLKVPILVGTGNEILYQQNLEVVRGSSSSVDQRVVQEDADGRAVVSVSLTGAVTLGDFDGTLNRIRVRNYPIVSGDGSGITTTKRSSVSVTINGEPVVVASVDGATGIITLSQEPVDGDTVRVSYYFKRTDTFITDDLSDQVTDESAEIRGEIGLASGETYDIVSGSNDTMVLSVDRASAVTFTFPEGSFSAAQIVSIINGQSLGTLVASTFVNNYGYTAIKLSADEYIKVGTGTSNPVFGFQSNYYTSRNKTFYTFQGPIVDGSNGGVTTTSPSSVTVTIDGVAVTASSVDGANRSVVLPFAPKSGAEVKIGYWFNTWQDTFDYLAHVGVSEVLGCGITPDRSDYTEEVDYILKDDKIYWGSASSVSDGVSSSTSTSKFGTSQITTLLVDNKVYYDECTPVVVTTVTPPVDSRKIFRLNNVPTTGDGRNSPIGSTTLGVISNGRIDLPTNRPDLVSVYWGHSLQDAIERGPVTVLSVDPTTATVTLKDSVEIGASVWASYYYNTLSDNEYTLSVVVPGSSGVGTYKVVDKNGNSLYNTKFGTKSAGLSGITVEFPSGSELLPDARMESVSSSGFTGPVEELVTVTFSETQDTPAIYSIPGKSPYYPVRLASDKAAIVMDGGAVPMAYGAAGLDLSAPTGTLNGFFASYVGEEVVYDESTGNTYTIDSSNNEVALTVDGVLLSTTVTPALGADLDDYVTAINASAVGTGSETKYSSVTKFTSPVVIDTNEFDQLNLRYNGNVTGAKTAVATITPGTYTSTSLRTEINSQLTNIFTVQATGTVTFGVGGDVPVALDKITIGGVDLTGVAAPRTPGSDDFNVGAVDLGVELAAAINDASNSFASICTATAGAGPSCVIEAVALGSLGNAVTFTSSAPTHLIITGTGTLESGEDGATVSADLNSSGQLVFKFEKEPTDAAGYLEFLSDATPAQDFAILAGIDTGAPDGTQTKLYHGPIARRFTVGAGPLNHDRLILRGRLIPGQGTVHFAHNASQTSFEITGVSGTNETGLVSGRMSKGGYMAAVSPATLFGHIGLIGGQDADGQPVVTFYDGTGTEPANHVFKINVDGVPVTVVFTASDVGTDTHLGPISDGTSILGQIDSAMVSAGFTTLLVARQEGAGIRFLSQKSDQFSYLEIGNGSANSVLGFTEGSSATRSAVDVEVVASAMMGHHALALADYLLDFANPTAGYFAAQAMAGVGFDEVGGKSLWIQSQTAGISSSVVWNSTTAGTRDALRYGTGFDVVSGSGAIGEDGSSGFFVTSSDPADGSGSANTSFFNAGVGQDGIVGQTYRDSVTGLSFTVLSREGGIAYPNGESFTFNVSKTFVTDSNIPTKAIPGVEMLVTNTSGMVAGDTGLVDTFERGGLEPANGDVYYVTYSYTKQSFASQLYTKLSAIEAAFGEFTPDYPLSLGSYLAVVNGAVTIAVKQIPKDDGLETASQSKYDSALDELADPLPGGVRPDIIVPLIGATTDYLRRLAVHCDVQSSTRYRQERTAIAGFSQPMTPTQVSTVAKAISNYRIRLVYPESVLISTTDFLGNTEQYLADGFYMAAALAGSVVSPNYDIATPWTRRVILGFDETGRKMNEVQANAVSVSGVVVLEDRNPNLIVRDGLTTDMTNILTKEPTVALVADEVQQRTRATLDKYIGSKFLPGILGDIETSMRTMMKKLKSDNLILDYTGISASADDYNSAIVEAYWAPIFALKYIQVQYNLRASL